MPTYAAPVRDTLFVLNDVLGYQRYSNLPGFADASPDVLEAILARSPHRSRRCRASPRPLTPRSPAAHRPRQRPRPRQ